PFPTRRSSDLPLPGHELVERIDLALDLDAGLLRRVLARVIRGHGHERIHRVKIRLAGREPAAGQQQEHSASHARCKSMSHGQSPPCFLLTCFSITRSEEHTSELQSRFDLVCRLLLEKKKRMLEYMNTIDSEA